MFCLLCSFWKQNCHSLNLGIETSKMSLTGTKFSFVVSKSNWKEPTQWNVCGLNVFNLYLELLISNKGDALKDHFLLSRHEGRNVPWVLFAISDFHKISFITTLCSPKYFSELSFLHSADHGKTLIQELFEVHVSGGVFPFITTFPLKIFRIWGCSPPFSTQISLSCPFSVLCLFSVPCPFSVPVPFLWPVWYKAPFAHDAF